MELTTLWFILEMILWIGYFVLEGFDFGVGMSLALVARRDRERHAVLSTIGPVWDGNEVWVIVAGGAMFAAFPGWYATTFSTFYLPLLAILFGLIIRAVGLEYREHRAEAAWRRGWDLCIIVGSALPAVLWGVAFAGMVEGLPINAQQDFTGSLLDLISPFALLGGLVTAMIFLTHGAVFLTLKTTGELRRRAGRVAWVSGPVAAGLAVIFLGWLQLLPTVQNHRLVLVLSAVSAVALLFGLIMHRAGHDGWAFIGTAATAAGVVATLFAALFPQLIPSTLDPAWSLTVTNASASHYTLTIMTWSAVVLLPLVIGYQAWTYWVFRQRVRHEPAAVPPEVPPVPAPSSAVTR